MRVDWVSLVIVVLAYALTRFSRLSLRQQNLINAAAMFSVFGWRAWSLGLEGTNGLITGAAGVLGVVHLVRAVRSSSPPRA